MLEFDLSVRYIKPRKSKCVLFYINYIDIKWYVLLLDGAFMYFANPRVVHSAIFLIFKYSFIILNNTHYVK